MLVADGRRAVLCGNIGDPVLDVLAEPADLLAVELSSFQLFWAPSLRPEAGAVLNVAEDHLDWHGGFDAYAAAKAGALTGRVAVVGLDDAPAAGLLPARARAGQGGVPARRAGGRRTGRARGDARRPGVRRATLELAPVASISVAGPVGVLDALGAAALARAVGVAPASIAAALAGFRVGRHRAETRGRRRRRHLCRRLQGHQPARRPGLGAGLPAGGVGGRWPAQGRLGRRHGRPGRGSAGRGGADRPRPCGGCRGVIATRARCPRHRGCDRGGCSGA